MEVPFDTTTDLFRTVISYISRLRLFVDETSAELFKLERDNNYGSHLRPLM